MSEGIEEDQDGCDSIGIAGLADKMKAVSDLVERRRHQVRRRDALLREAVHSLLQPVSAEPGAGTVPPPASRLAGLSARPAWQRVIGTRWLVAMDLVNNTHSEVPYPCLLLSISPDEPLVYESRLVRLPFKLEKEEERPSGGLSPGDTVRTIAMVELPAAAGSDGCRLSLTLSSPPGQHQLDNDVGFYQLPAGDVMLAADDLLSRRRALFTGTGATAEDLQAVWALSGRPLRLRLQPPRPVSLQAGRDRLLQAGYAPAGPAVTLTDAGHPLFGCLVLLLDGDSADADRHTADGDASDGTLAATLWCREERQLPLLLHQLRQLIGPGCQLLSARRPHTAQHLRDALLTQLQFVEARVGGTRVAGGPERRALRLGDVHVPMAEYASWRRRLTELEDTTAACALDLVEPEHALR